MMRSLAFDWREDTAVYGIKDQYMFGPAFLVSPVTTPGATSRSVYLPKGVWYEFGSGKRVSGGVRMEVAAPIENLPLFVRAGSIVPMGGFEEWAMQKTADTLELRVYPGADGDFEWYSDAGDTYDYENGQYRTVRIHWDDSARTLTLGESNKRFPGMLERVHIRLVLVRDAHGVGSEITEASDAEGAYDGKTLHIEVH